MEEAMDIISRAMMERRQISSRKELNDQTWEDFEEKRIGKKVVIFGAGPCASIFWEKYADQADVCEIIDSDESKQGVLAGEIIPELFLLNNHSLVVQDLSYLKKYDAEDIIVLVASTYYYESMVCKLEELGIIHIFVILIMEANFRMAYNYDLKSDIYTLKEKKIKCAESYSHLPIERNKIIFRGAGSYSDHGKYITEQLLKCDENLDIVWIVNKLDKQVPQGVRLVLLSNWGKYLYEMETAHIWITDQVFEDYIKKRPQQRYIQTKHWASVTLKKFYLDASTITDVEENVALWEHNSNIMDYIIVGSEFDENSCRRGFNFSKDFLRIGSPRTDAMFHKDIMKYKICCEYKIPPSTKMLCYAPTYRYKQNIQGSHIAEARNIDLDYVVIRKVLQESFGGEWIILLRLHPSVVRESKNIKHPEYVIDVSDYDDGEELCAACDILISDYSSIMFEPAFVKKPVFLLATDRTDYIDKEYDLLIDYDKLPFPIAESNAELVENIRNFDQMSYEKRVADFLEAYGVHEDGHASERAAEFILNLIETSY